MTIEIIKINTKYVHLRVANHTFVVRQGDLIALKDREVIKKCDFCGREYDENEYIKTMQEQCRSRDVESFRFTNSTTCGLWCAWLKSPSMIRTIKNSKRNGKSGEERLEEMKDDIAQRVAKYLRKDQKCQQ